jgi:GGDEF domain-containing protein
MFEKISKIKPLVYSIEIRDPYTKGHSERVALYASEFLKSIKEREDLIRDAYFAGLLHDIGKIAIPDDVLLKPSILNHEEFTVIKYHPVLSADLIKKMDDLAYLSDIVKHHHENYDGSGYPDRLKGNDIPYLSRILSLADVFDALTTDRIYRDAFGIEEALEIMNSMKYKFDPRLYKKFTGFIKEFGVIKKPVVYIEEKDEKTLYDLRKKIFFEDTFTGLLNRNALMLVIRKAIEKEYKVTLIELNVKNYKILHRMHGFEKVERIIREISVQIKKTFELHSVDEEISEDKIYVFKESVARFVFLGFKGSESILRKIKPCTCLRMEKADLEFDVVFENKPLDYNFEKFVNFVI